MHIADGKYFPFSISGTYPEPGLKTNLFINKKGKLFISNERFGLKKMALLQFLILFQLDTMTVYSYDKKG